MASRARYRLAVGGPPVNIDGKSRSHSGGDERVWRVSPGHRYRSCLFPKKYEATQSRLRRRKERRKLDHFGEGGAGDAARRPLEEPFQRETVGERADRGCILNSPIQARPFNINAVSIGLISRRAAKAASLPLAQFRVNSPTHFRVTSALTHLLGYRKISRALSKFDRSLSYENDRFRVPLRDKINGKVNEQVSKICLKYPKHARVYIYIYILASTILYTLLHLSVVYPNIGCVCNASICLRFRLGYASISLIKMRWSVRYSAAIPE